MSGYKPTQIMAREAILQAVCMFQARTSCGRGTLKKEWEWDTYHSLTANCSRTKQQNEEKTQEGMSD